MTEQHQYLTLTQASKLSGWSVWKLRRLIDQGKLMGSRSLRGDRIVLREHLESLLEEVTNL